MASNIPKFQYWYYGNTGKDLDTKVWEKSLSNAWLQLLLFLKSM